MDELKELLQKAHDNYAALKAKFDAQATKLKEIESTSDEFKQKQTEFTVTSNLVKEQGELIDELKNSIADLKEKGVGAKPEFTPELEEKLVANAQKLAIGKFVRAAFQAKQKGAQPETDLLGMIDAEYKAASLNLTNTGEGKEAVQNVLGTMIIERAREAVAIVAAVGRKPISRNYREEVLVTFPSVEEGIENVAGSSIPDTTTQEYREVVNRICKLSASPRITDEAMYGSDLDLFGHLVSLLSQEFDIKLALNILQGAGTGKAMRGILSSNRLDITNLTGKSFLPTFAADPANARPADYYPALPTGVSGSLGATASATVDFLVDMETELPSAYLSTASWYMNRRTLGTLKKLKNTQGDPIFMEGYMGNRATILGYPVVIEDRMPDIAADSSPIIFGDLSQAFYIDTGDIDKVLPNPYIKKGCTVYETDQEFFEIVGKNDAIVIAACTTNAGA